VTAVLRVSIRPTSDRLAIAARAIEPILNRVVLAGPPVVALLMNDPAVRAPHLTFGADSTLQLITTSMVDRLGVDLQRLGLTRIGRTGDTDRWLVAGDIALDLVQVRTDESDPAQPWLEYATLLTLPYSIDAQLVVRIAGAPAVLALELASFANGGMRALDSEELERVVLLIAGRTEIEKECTAAPPELRSMIASSLARLAGNDTLQLLVQRALPDAALLPALAVRVRERIVRMAA
jgi:hypothetical protein